MNILWLNWKDIQHPQAGGAEAVTDQIASRLVRDGNEVTLLSGGWRGCERETKIHGYKVVRLGNRVSLYWKAFRYYKKYLQDRTDIIIEEVNTIPFFSKFYAKNKKRVILMHQLAREIWFYQMPFPLDILGYSLEIPYLRFLRGEKVITISQSSKDDFIKFCGFKAEDISIIPLGIEIAPTESLGGVVKEQDPTLIYLGSIRAMKQPLEVLQAFKEAKKSVPNLKLWFAGSGEGSYFEYFKKEISQPDFTEDITYFGRVPAEKKKELVRKAHIIAVTSVREGWGLIVTEANSQGTPAVVYNVSGLRDSVRHNETGLVCSNNTPQNLSENIVALLKNKDMYARLQKNAWEWSKSLTPENSYQIFKNILFNDLNFGQKDLAESADMSLVSVIVPTKNSDKFLEACLKSIKNQAYKNIEIIVVDNNSSDKTIEIAKQYTDKVFTFGPERSAQRNFGAKQAKGKYLFFIDSDMELSPNVVSECVHKITANYLASIVPEQSFGKGFWAECKALERSFYVGVSWIEAARFFQKDAFEKVGGYDENLVSGEDWDLSQRAGKIGGIARINSYIFHNEGELSLKKYLKKKFYYARHLAKYSKKGHNGAKSKQFSPFLRFGLYLSHPIKLFKDPVVGLGMIFMKKCEFFVTFVGLLIYG